MHTQHPLIALWAIKKYDLPEGTEVFVEGDTISGGFCETCWYEYEVVRVKVKKPGETTYTEVDQFDGDLAGLLNEILDAAAAELGPRLK